MGGPLSFLVERTLKHITETTSGSRPSDKKSQLSWLALLYSLKRSPVGSDDYPPQIPNLFRGSLDGIPTQSVRFEIAMVGEPAYILVGLEDGWMEKLGPAIFVHVGRDVMPSLSTGGLKLTRDDNTKRRRGRHTEEDESVRRD